MQRWFKLEATLFKLLSNFVFRMENVDLANFIPSQIQLDGVSRKNARYFISYVLQSQASYNEVQAENLAGLWTADGSYLKKTTLEEFSHIWNSNMLGVYLFRAVQETIGAVSNTPLYSFSSSHTTLVEGGRKNKGRVCKNEVLIPAITATYTTGFRSYDNNSHYCCSPNSPSTDPSRNRIYFGRN